MTAYQYKLKSPSTTRLGQLVPGPVSSAAMPDATRIVIDVPSTSKDDLDEAMAAFGYVPATSTVAAFEDSTGWFGCITRSNAPPAGTSAGDRVLVGTAGSGAFSGHNNEIATSDGVSGWTFTLPQPGLGAFVFDDGRLYSWTGAAWVSRFLSPASSTGAAFAPTNDLRLTGVSGQPVMLSDNVGLSTIYLTPYRGSRIALYDGSAWQLRTTAEVSLAVTDRTADLPFDIFAYDDAGTVKLELLDWASATARATALVQQDGVQCKSGALTRRYVGSCWARSATTFNWVQNGDGYPLGGNRPVMLDLWNMDNRVTVPWLLRDTDPNAITYAGAIRQWEGSTKFQVEIIAGLEEESIWGSTSAIVEANGRLGAVTWGYDATARATEAQYGVLLVTGFARRTVHADIVKRVGLGRHFLTWLQSSDSGLDVQYLTSVEGSLCVGEWRC